VLVQHRQVMRLRHFPPLLMGCCNSHLAIGGSPPCGVCCGIASAALDLSVPLASRSIIVSARAWTLCIVAGCRCIASKHIKHRVALDAMYHDLLRLRRHSHCRRMRNSIISQRSVR
jgi:hypothetical protein